MTDQRFDRDPEALAWARSHVQRQVDRMTRFMEQAKERGADERPWKTARYVMESSLIGGHGCSIASFDERLPDLPTECIHGYALGDREHKCGLDDDTAGSAGAALKASYVRQ